MHSIVQEEKECFICKSKDVELHHVFFSTALRKIADADGLTVYLCPLHHRGNPTGVHFNHELDLHLKQIAEKKWLEHYNKSIDDFIKRYGKNVL